MIASVHLADVGAGSALKVLRKAPKAPGLRHANVGLAAPLSASVIPKPALGRAGLIAFWDVDAALGGFVADHPMADALSDGWRVRLAPLRLHGSWPGVPDDLPRARKVDHQGPATVLTMGRVKFNRIVPFFGTSAKAAGAVLDAPGRIWSTGLAKSPFVATCSLWESDEALAAYAYGDTPAHPEAIAKDRARGFHHQSAFIRFRPYDSHGHLDGTNPLPEEWMASA